MNKEMLMLADAIALEKNVERDVVFAAIEAALAQATKKFHHKEADGGEQIFHRWALLKMLGIVGAGATSCVAPAKIKPWSVRNSSSRVLNTSLGGLAWLHLMITKCRQDGSGGRQSMSCLLRYLRKDLFLSPK